MYAKLRVDSIEELFEYIGDSEIEQIRIVVSEYTKIIRSQKKKGNISKNHEFIG